MDVGQLLSMVLLVAGIWAVFRIPTNYLLGYSEWIREKHGASVKLGFTLLVLIVGTCLALTLEKPGKYDMLEPVVTIVALLVCGAAAWDNFQFWRVKYRRHQ